MIVASSQACAPQFTTQTADGESADATGTPTGTLYVNGTANAAVITVTNVSTGLYKASFTTPAGLSDYAGLELLISATIDGTAAQGKIWSASVLNLTPAAALAAYDPPTKAEMDAAIAGLGTGARTVTITVDDGTDPLQAARVRVTQGAVSLVQSTNVSGVATFNLDDATWTVAITKAGYSFAGASLVVNGNETQTYSMTLVAITPSDPGATTGYVTIRTNAGVPIADITVQVEVMKLANGTTGSGIDNPLAEGTTDDDGLVEFTGLPRLATYRVRIGTGGKWFTGVTLDAGTTPLAGVLGIAE